jgi:ribose transport system ATP-binding protein
MALLQLENITKSFFGVEVLHGVNLTLERGKIVGLIGENGSGKSTTMNILGGVHQPDSGRMSIDGVPYAPTSPRDALANGISFIHQELNLFPNLSIEENLYIRGFPKLHWMLPVIDRKKIRTRTKQLLELVDLQIPPGTLVSRLSQGERQLVEIAKALSTDARIIIFDEPTTSLTRNEIDRLFNIVDRLRKQQIGVIYISHILNDVLRLADSITVLRDGNVVGSAEKSEFTIDRMISMMVGRSIKQLFPKRNGGSSGEPLLKVEGLTQPGIIRNVSFSIARGEILGLAGLMGAGRSETARILFGLDSHKSGTIEIEGQKLENADAHAAMRAGMAFLTEDRRAEGLLMNLPIYDSEALPNLDAHSHSATGWIDNKALQSKAEDYSKQVQLNTAGIGSVLARNLSGGNQQKVVLAKWLMRKPRLFILDEPTRGVDIGAKAEIYRIINALVDEGCAVLMISSEMEELIGMCDRILVMSNGEITGSFNRKEFNQERILEAAMRPARQETHT